MITVIKHGKKEFKGYCSRCGCEFTYEFEDIQSEAVRGLTNYSSTRYVKCPDCGDYVYIGTTSTPPSQPGWPIPGEPIPCAPTEANKIDPCKDCDWMKKMLSGITYVGDVPCTWCNKGPYKVTCDTISGNGTTATLSGLTCTYTGNIGSYTMDPVMNEYMSSLADASNETNKAECNCSNSCLKRTEVFSNNNYCCEDCCAK